MDEPGPRLPLILAAAPIIEEARQRPLWARLRDIALTAALWLLYAYLIRDFLMFLAEAVAWLLGLGPVPPRAQLALPLFPTLGSYAMIALMNALALISWALYNQMRFRGRERRKASPFVTPADMARMYGVTAEEVAAWQQARILIVHHDGDGGLVGVELPEPPANPSDAERAMTIEPAPGPPTQAPGSS
jgi:biofilm PGA synthesis protein PgaD